MPVREKVINGLECCTTYDKNEFPLCENCPYSLDEETCASMEALHKDALALLKAQEPRVMTLEEVKVADYTWLESRNGHLFVPVLIVPGKANIVIVTIYGTALLKEADYNMQWRCWTSRPTNEQREATPWVKT